MTNVQPAGFVVLDGVTIRATGKDPYQAWANFATNLYQDGLKWVVTPLGIAPSEEPPISEARGYVLSCDCQIFPATAALLSQVEVEGAAVVWRSIDDLICTKAEAGKA